MDQKPQCQRFRIWLGRLAWLTGGALLILAGFFGIAIDARAEKNVVFSKITDPVDFEEAVRYWRGKLNPETYDNERDFEDRNIWPVTKTVEDYVRHYIRIGKADINDDDINELFYVQEDPRFCGSIGCPVVVLEKRHGVWAEICGTRGGAGLEITDWLTESGGDYREMEARYRIFWQKGICLLDDPEIREYYPPPPGRIWKPMR